MKIKQEELNHLANLAGLELGDREQQLNDELNQIMDFVEQLKSVNTQGLSPLYHPLDQSQRFRRDKPDEQSCLKELEAIAPLFDEQMYLVPDVIETE